ncbi:MAG: hypothetical protein IKO05_09230 [Selenomonadaceae bacterium]|nr:hypothetical protein [Selenomonadaceae bacterium]
MADIYNIKSNTLVGGNKVTIDSGDGNDSIYNSGGANKFPFTTREKIF